MVESVCVLGGCLRMCGHAYTCALRTELSSGPAAVLTVPLFSFRPRAYCLADSDEESSSAGSSDEDDAPDPSGGDKQLLPGAEG